MLKFITDKSNTRIFQSKLITFDLEWTSEWLLFDIKCSFFSYVVGIRHYFSMRWWCLLCIRSKYLVSIGDFVCLSHKVWLYIFYLWINLDFYTCQQPYDYTINNFQEYIYFIVTYHMILYYYSYDHCSRIVKFAILWYEIIQKYIYLGNCTFYWIMLSIMDGRT